MPDLPRLLPTEPGPRLLPPTELEPGRPLLISDLDDDVAYYGVLDESRYSAGVR